MHPLQDDLLRTLLKHSTHRRGSSRRQSPQPAIPTLSISNDFSPLFSTSKTPLYSASPPFSTSQCRFEPLAAVLDLLAPPLSTSRRLPELIDTVPRPFKAPFRVNKVLSHEPRPLAPIFDPRRRSRLHDLSRPVPSTSPSFPPLSLPDADVWTDQQNEINWAEIATLGLQRDLEFYVKNAAYGLWQAACGNRNCVSNSALSAPSPTTPTPATRILDHDAVADCAQDATSGNRWTEAAS